MAGAVGTLLTGIFASQSEMSARNGAAYGNSEQFGIQLAALAITVAVCVVGTSISFFIVRAAGDVMGLPVRVPVEHEADIDKSMVRSGRTSEGRGPGCPRPPPRGRPSPRRQPHARPPMPARSPDRPRHHNNPIPLQHGEHGYEHLSVSTHHSVSGGIAQPLAAFSATPVAPAASGTGVRSENSGSNLGSLMVPLAPGSRSPTAA